MKSKNRPSKLNGGKYFFLLVLGILASITSCFGLILFALGNPQMLCFGTLFPSSRHFEELARIEFPDSATNITYEFNESGELIAPRCTIWLRFDMNPEDFENFRHSTLVENFENIPIDEKIFYLRMEEMSWYQPENLRAGYAYSGSIPFLTQWIFIDINNQDKWIVYVILEEAWLD